MKSNKPSKPIASNTPNAFRDSRRSRRLVLHVVRVGLFCLVILFIRIQHAEFAASATAVEFARVDVSRLRRLFPKAHLVSTDNSRAGKRGDEGTVLDATGKPIGYLLQTSPYSDPLVGFSGPTNVLIAFTPDDRVVGIDVVSSRDTREHVAQVLEDESFMNAFNRLTWEQVAALPKLDGVSGATLTSVTMQESIIMRLSGGRPSLKFDAAVHSADVKGVFPDADTVTQDPHHSSLWHVEEKSGRRLGAVLRTSPAADQIFGYQGPTETLIGFGDDGRVIGIAIGKSYDNDEYVAYVRDDEYFVNLFNGLLIEELLLDDLATLDHRSVEVDQLGQEEVTGRKRPTIEGVSGATMTSMAVTEGLMLAAAKHREEVESRVVAASRFSAVPWTTRDAGTALIILLGLVIGLTNLRGNRVLRVGFQLMLVGYLGLMNGDMVSQAMLVGWAQNSVPWANAGGLILLTFAAFLVPITSRRNIYCSHLCPHGAAQHLLKNRLPWQLRLPRRWGQVLKVIPALLLLWCVVVAMAGLSFSLIGIEPFDAWVFRIAGWATISVAVVGLVASLFVPMAYCRYGCPTGALLNFLRFNGRSDQWARRDWFALSLVAVATGLWMAG